MSTSVQPILASNHTTKIPPPPQFTAKFCTTDGDSSNDPLSFPQSNYRILQKPEINLCPPVPAPPLRAIPRSDSSTKQTFPLTPIYGGFIRESSKISPGVSALPRQNYNSAGQRVGDQVTKIAFEECSEVGPALVIRKLRVCLVLFTGNSLPYTQRDKLKWPEISATNMALGLDIAAGRFVKGRYERIPD
ncbi:hypothetical protein CEXT_291381 [Caerostris extrusa]|uniref:Uncharacterized protein n=1 Tax=Caerostris extrusa TaxID=172846 RepID=A0AAV4SGV6_CAEEX|nr:hypothetical protein CEXT_291381 [Caerostris extrusa]